MAFLFINWGHMNNQSISPQDHREDGSLQIVEIFRTLQGEGPFAGHRAIFVRLTGCNLQCPACDTDYTTKSARIHPDELISILSKFGTVELVVLTGGEPFRQNLGPVVKKLIDAGYIVQIETNGTLFQPLPFADIMVVCSPKTAKIHPKLEPHIAAFKYVLTADSVAEDGLPIVALHHLSEKVYRPRPDFKGTIYVQPLDDKDNPRIIKRHQRAAVASAINHGHVLCLQLHKILDLP
jgi:7-carboxy-7-deazaguanine synthase